jgi:hypothetical protein
VVEVRTVRLPWGVLAEPWPDEQDRFLAAVGDVLVQEGFGHGGVDQYSETPVVVGELEAHEGDSEEPDVLGALMMPPGA